jgi:hypothetical protein
MRLGTRRLPKNPFPSTVGRAVRVAGKIVSRRFSSFRQLIFFLSSPLHNWKNSPDPDRKAFTLRPLNLMQLHKHHFHCAILQLLLLLLLTLCIHSLHAQPDNDNFANRQLLSGTNITVPVYLIDVTNEPGEPDLSPNLQSVVWYSWNAPEDGAFVVSLDNSALQEYVFTGSGLQDLASVPPGNPSAYAVKGGVSYSIAVGSRNTSAPPKIGELNLHFIPRPANDLFANRELLSGESVTVSGWYGAAKYDPGEPLVNVTAQPLVWFKWRAPTAGKLFAREINSGNLAFFRGGTLSELVFAGQNDGIIMAPGESIQIAFASTSWSLGSFGLQFYRPCYLAGAVPGGTFSPLPEQQVRLEGFAPGETITSAVGYDFSDYVYLPPDLSPFILPNGPGAHHITATLLTSAGHIYLLEPFDYSIVHPQQDRLTAPFVQGAELDLEFNTTGAPNATVWWRWKPTASGKVVPEIKQDNFPEVRQGAFEIAVIPVSAEAQQTTWDVQAGSEYFIRITSAFWNTAKIGRFIVRLADPDVPHDDIANALLITGTNFSHPVYLPFATWEATEPPSRSQITNSSVWYKFTAPSDGAFQASFNPCCLSGADIAVFDNSFENLVKVPWQEFKPIVSVKAGSTYLIRLASSWETYSEKEGAYTLNFSFIPAPANDSFAQSAVFPAASFSLTGATVEPGEPLVYDQLTPSKTVWFSWSTRVTTPVILELPSMRSKESSMHPIIEVFKGNSLSSLDRVSVLPVDNGVSWFQAEPGRYCIRLSTPPFSSASSAPFDLDLIEIRLSLPSFVLSSPFPMTLPAPTNLSFHVSGPLLSTPNLSIQYQAVRHYTNATSALHFGTWPITRPLSDPLIGDFAFQATLLPGLHFVSARAQIGDGSVHFSPSHPIVVRPSNDNFANASLISGRNLSITGTLAGATAELAESLFPNEQKPLSTVWYKWQAPARGPVTIGLSGWEFLSRVFRVGTSGLLLPVDQGTQLQAQFMAEPGEPVWIRVSSTQAFDSVIGLKPFALEVRQSSFSWALGSYSYEPGQILNPVTTEVADSVQEVVHFLGIEPIGTNYFYSITNSVPAYSFVIPNLTPGFYYLRSVVKFRSGEVLEFRPNGGAIQIKYPSYSAEAAPDLKNAVGPVQLPFFDPDGYQGPASPTAIARWTSPTDGALILSHSLAAVIDLTSLSSVELTQLSPNSPGGRPDLLFHAAAGRSFLLYLTNGFTTGTNSVHLRFISVAPNDNFADAIPVAGWSVGHTATTWFARVEPGEPDLYSGGTRFGFPARTVWYKWKAPGSGLLFPQCTTDFELFVGTDIGNLARVPKPNQGDIFTQSSYIVSSDRDNYYYIRVSATLQGSPLNGTPQSTWSIAFNPSDPPPNDDYSNRTTLVGTNMIFRITLEHSTLQQGESFPGLTLGSGSAWWAWTAPDDGLVVIRETKPNGLRPEGALFRSSATFGQAPAAIGRGLVRLGVTRGENIQIRFTGGSTYAELLLLPSIENDLFDIPRHLSGSNVRILGSNLGAHRQIHEPFHAGAYGGRSVWYTWTAPERGNVNLELNAAAVSGALHPLLVAVYRGQFLGSLEPLVSARSGIGYNFPLRFMAEAGQQYHIAIDGELGAVGEFDLQLELTPDESPLALSASLTPEGSIQLQLPRLSAQPITIETSTDLQTFLPLETFPTNSTTRTFPPAQPRQFFRLNLSIP